MARPLGDALCMATMFPLSAEDALAFARDMVPRWVEHNDCVLNEAAFDAENFEQWWDRCQGNAEAVKAVINHVHLWDILPTTGENDYGPLWDLGEIFVLTWTASLTKAFPGRRFEVSLTDDYGLTINAWTVRE